MLLSIQVRSTAPLFCLGLTAECGLLLHSGHFVVILGLLGLLTAMRCFTIFLISGVGMDAPMGN